MDIPNPDSQAYTKTSEALARDLKREREQNVIMAKIVALYVCPACGSYYGSSNMGILESQENTSSIGPIEDRGRGFRDECPDCKSKGKTVKRIKRYARLIPIEEVNTAFKAARRKLLEDSNQSKKA